MVRGKDGQWEGIERAVWTSLPLSILPSACMEGGMGKGKDGKREGWAEGCMDRRRYGQRDGWIEGGMGIEWVGQWEG